MTGKQKCKILRQIRRDIAEANQLDYTERDCTHTGDCTGTCPYCEAQLRKLEEKLEERRSLGQRIAVMGLSMGLLATNLTACDPFSPLRATQGDMMPDSTAQTDVTDSFPGELITAETTTEPPMIEGEMTVEPLMGDIVLPEPEVLMGKPVPPETEPPMPTMGVLPVPELPEPETVTP